MDSRTPDDYLSRCQARFDLGDLEGALADVDHVLRVDPNNALAHEVRAWVLGNQARYAEAEVEYARAIELGSEDESVKLNLLVTQFTRLALEDPEKARALAKRIQRQLGDSPGQE